MKPKLIIGNKNYSSWSLRAWFLLREADIDFDEHRIALDVEDTARQIAEFSPAGKVPVLLLDDVAVWDSLATGRRKTSGPATLRRARTRAASARKCIRVSGSFVPGCR